MTEQRECERGSAMILTLAVVAGLALLAMIVVSIATSAKWTEFAEYTHSRAFYSADAAGEAAINWIRFQPSPPAIIDGQNHVFVAGGATVLSANHSYQYDVQFVRKRFREGWSLDYKDYEYLIDADGASAQQSEAAIEVRVTRLFKEGYQ